MHFWLMYPMHLRNHHCYYDVLYVLLKLNFGHFVTSLYIQQTPYRHWLRHNELPHQSLTCISFFACQTRHFTCSFIPKYQISLFIITSSVLSNSSTKCFKIGKQNKKLCQWQGWLVCLIVFWTSAEIEKKKMCESRQFCLCLNFSTRIHENNQLFLRRNSFHHSHCSTSLQQTTSRWGCPLGGTSDTRSSSWPKLYSVKEALFIFHTDYVVWVNCYVNTSINRNIVTYALILKQIFKMV